MSSEAKDFVQKMSELGLLMDFEKEIVRYEPARNKRRPSAPGIKYLENDSLITWILGDSAEEDCRRRLIDITYKSVSMGKPLLLTVNMALNSSHAVLVRGLQQSSKGYRLITHNSWGAYGAHWVLNVEDLCNPRRNNNAFLHYSSTLER